MKKILLILALTTQTNLISNSNLKKMAEKIEFLKITLEGERLKKLINSGVELSFQQQLRCQELGIKYRIDSDAIDFAQLRALGSK